MSKIKITDLADTQPKLLFKHITDQEAMVVIGGQSSRRQPPPPPPPPPDRAADDLTFALAA